MVIDFQTNYLQLYLNRFLTSCLFTPHIFLPFLCVTMAYTNFSQLYQSPALLTRLSSVFYINCIHYHTQTSCLFYILLCLRILTGCLFLGRQNSPLRTLGHCLLNMFNNFHSSVSHSDAWKLLIHFS